MSGVPGDPASSPIVKFTVVGCRCRTRHAPRSGADEVAQLTGLGRHVLTAMARTDVDPHGAGIVDERTLSGSTFGP